MGERPEAEAGEPRMAGPTVASLAAGPRSPPEQVGPASCLGDRLRPYSRDGWQGASCNPVPVSGHSPSAS